MGDWKSAFAVALSKSSIDHAIECLQSQAISHAGTAPAKTKIQAIEMMSHYWSGRPNELFQVARKLCLFDDPTAQEIGAFLLAESYSGAQSEVCTILRKLSDNPNWEVREWVASACGEILIGHFDQFFRDISTWVFDDSPNVRRTALLALMYAGKSRNVDYAAPILDTVETLMTDGNPYVRKNLGPYALGSGLIKYYPDQVLERLHLWVNSKDEQVRWNVAMVFTAAAGAAYAERARPVLETLQSDPSPLVRRATVRAMKNVRRRFPELWQDGE